MGAPATGQQYRSKRDRAGRPSIRHPSLEPYSTVTAAQSVEPRRTYEPSMTPFDWTRYS